MAIRPPMELVRDRWRRSPFHGGLLGIASVALATVAVAVVCAGIALVVALIY
jgi:hypothetical protein